MASLGEWISANDGRVRVSSALDPVSDKSCDVYGAIDRTIYARGDISEGDVLVELERDAILNSAVWLESAAKILDSGKFHELEKDIAALQPSRTVLAVMSLLAERARGADSVFHGYIAQLPQRVPLPLSWGGEAKKLLKDTAAHPIMDDELVMSLYHRFGSPLAQKFPDLWPTDTTKLDDFVWAYMMVSSRAFSIDGADGVTLLPVIDMANHDPTDPAAAIERSEEGVYSLVALRHVKSGTPVTISYGDLSNAQLLCRYGFTLPEAIAIDSILISSVQVRMVYDQLTTGGSADAALLQLEYAATESAKSSASDSPSSPSAKRRKLFPDREPVGADSESDSIVFTLHSDAAREFGLSDGLTSFLFAQDLPLELLYDVLSVLLQHKDKLYSVLLNRNDDAPTEQVRLARALISHERQVCRRILLGITSLEEDSDEDEGSDDEQVEEDEEDYEDDDA